jgi:thiol-disulfide isomerase/thioredoxin
MSERLGTTEFKDRIFDFESSGDWQYKGGLPCVIDFWAEWCPPCKMIAPLLEELAVEYSGRVRFYNVNSDE